VGATDRAMKGEGEEGEGRGTRGEEGEGGTEKECQVVRKKGGRERG
jgi:hypothetical protein